MLPMWQSIQDASTTPTSGSQLSVAQGLFICYHNLHLWGLCWFLTLWLHWTFPAGTAPSMNCSNSHFCDCFFFSYILEVLETCFILMSLLLPLPLQKSSFSVIPQAMTQVRVNLIPLALGTREDSSRSVFWLVPVIFCSFQEGLSVVWIIWGWLFFPSAPLPAQQVVSERWQEHAWELPGRLCSIHRVEEKCVEQKPIGSEISFFFFEQYQTTPCFSCMKSINFAT